MTAPVRAVGNRFGRLIVVAEAASRGGHRRIMARCDCGVDKVVRLDHLRSGLIESCGCLSREGNNRSHGEARKGKWTAEYRTWAGIKERCTNPKRWNYQFYGALGVKMCKEWFDSYESFVAYVGRRPSAQHSIDRYPNPAGNYEPGNVRWATRIEQARNKRGSAR